MLRIKHGKIWGLVYIAPIVLFVVVYMVYPVVFNFKASLFDWNGFAPDMTFIGLQNYRILFRDPILAVILKNFLIFGAVTIALQAFFGLMLAVILEKKFFGRDLIKAIIFMPAILSAVVIGNVFFRILEPNVGMLNTFLRSVGLGVFAQQWLGSEKDALWLLIAVQVWQWTGYSMTMYYAGLKAIPNELYEAAKIDGAGWWSTLFRITIPMLRSTTYGLTILGAIGVVKQFDLVWTMTKGGPANSTQFFSTYIYEVTFNQFKQGYACALAVLVFLIALIITVIQLILYNRNQIEY